MKLQALVGFAAATSAYAAAIQGEDGSTGDGLAVRDRGGWWPFGGWGKHSSSCNPPADLHNFRGEIVTNGERRQYDNWADFERELEHQRGSGRWGDWLPWIFPTPSCSFGGGGGGGGGLPTLDNGKQNAASTQSLSFTQPPQESQTVPEVTPSISISTSGVVPEPTGGVVTSTPDSNLASTSSSAASSSAIVGETSPNAASSAAPTSSSAEIVTSSNVAPPPSSSIAGPPSSSSSAGPLAPPTSDAGAVTSAAPTSAVTPESSVVGAPISTEVATVPPNNATAVTPSSSVTSGTPITPVTPVAPSNSTVPSTGAVPNATLSPTMSASLPPAVNGTAAPINATALPSTTMSAPPQRTTYPNSGSYDEPTVVQGLDKIRGVNLGGWLVYEGWITADGAGFGSGKGWVDEWTMAQTYDQNRDYINAYWRGWVTEQDFSEIAAAGLNTVRIPVGFWTFIPTKAPEPYRGQVETWQSLKNAFGWAKKYNLRIMLDMHAVPGPQSLDAHSGHKTNNATFFFSDDDKQRTINALTVAVREFTQPKYGGVLKSIMLVNEPRLPDDRKDEARALLKQFYVNAHNAIRALPEPGVKNVTILIHDSFDGAERYGDFRNVTGDPNVAMDRHLYAIFEPTKANWTGAAVMKAQCEQANALVDFAKKYYTVMVAEFGAPARGGSCSWFEGVAGIQNPGQCPGWGDEPDRVTWVKEDFLAQIQAYETVAGWVFWTWKTANGDIGWDMRRIIDKILHGQLGLQRFDQIKLDRCQYYNASMPKTS